MELDSLKMSLGPADFSTICGRYVALYADSTLNAGRPHETDENRLFQMDRP